MENIFDKFKKLNLDTSPIGLSIELREPFFCTPIGAQIIGWDNGIHYCFIKGFKEIVFCVNPETCCNYYGVYNDDIGLFDGAVTRRIL